MSKACVSDWLTDWLTDWLSDMPNSREASASKNLYKANQDYVKTSEPWSEFHMSSWESDVILNLFMSNPIDWVKGLPIITVW